MNYKHDDDSLEISHNKAICVLKNLKFDVV